MTASDFADWLAFMKYRKRAGNDAAAAALLGVHKNTLIRWKANGAPTHVALACAALLHGLPPFKPDGSFL